MFFSLMLSQKVSFLVPVFTILRVEYTFAINCIEEHNIVSLKKYRVVYFNSHANLRFLFHSMEQLDGWIWIEAGIERAFVNSWGSVSSNAKAGSCRTVQNILVTSGDGRAVSRLTV